MNRHDYTSFFHFALRNVLIAHIHIVQMRSPPDSATVKQSVIEFINDLLAVDHTDLIHGIIDFCNAKLQTTPLILAISPGTNYATRTPPYHQSHSSEFKRVLKRPRAGNHSPEASGDAQHEDSTEEIAVCPQQPSLLSKDPEINDVYGALALAAFHEMKGKDINIVVKTR